MTNDIDSIEVNMIVLVVTFFLWVDHMCVCVCVCVRACQGGLTFGGGVSNFLAGDRGTPPITLPVGKTLQYQRQN